MSGKRDVTTTLIEYESMLHSSVQRVGRAVRNLHQEMGGYASKVPGSGEPGGGKGGGPTVTIDDERVPITMVESQALGFGGVDMAARRLEQLRASAITVAQGLAAACTAGLTDVGSPFDLELGTSRVVVLGYARIRRLQSIIVNVVDDAGVRRVLDEIDDDLEEVFHICQKWGYTAGEPVVPKARAELLAVDMTERWCTSHLRVGARREREPGRGELCQWCYKFQAAEGFLPPVELVRIHVDDRRVYEHQIAPFRQAHRDRQRNTVRS